MTEEEKDRDRMLATANDLDEISDELRNIIINAAYMQTKLAGALSSQADGWDADEAKLFRDQLLDFADMLSEHADSLTESVTLLEQSAE